MGEAVHEREDRAGRARADMAAQHGLDGEGTGERTVRDLVADRVRSVAQQEAQELAQLRLAHHAQPQGEAAQGWCLAPAAFG